MQSVRPDQVKSLGLSFYQPRTLPMPWQSAEKLVDNAEVASQLNDGYQGLSVQIQQERLPVASLSDFQALVHLQQARSADDTVPLLARQVQGLAQAGFGLTGLSGYGAYLALNSGKEVQAEYKGLPFGKLSSSELPQQFDAMESRKLRFDQALQNADPGPAVLACYELDSSLSHPALAELDKDEALASGRSMLAGKTPEDQHNWLVALAQPKPGVTFQERVQLVQQLGLSQQPLGPETEAVLQSAAYMREKSPETPVVPLLDKIYRQADGKGMERLAQLPQLADPQDWYCLGAFGTSKSEMTADQRAELFRGAGLDLLHENLQSKAYSQLLENLHRPDFQKQTNILCSVLGGMTEKMQAEAWDAFLPMLQENPDRALWAAGFAAASQEVRQSRDLGVYKENPTKQQIMDLAQFRIPKDFQCSLSLTQMLADKLSKGESIQDLQATLAPLVLATSERDEKYSGVYKLLEGYETLTPRGRDRLVIDYVKREMTVTKALDSAHKFEWELKRQLQQLQEAAMAEGSNIPQEEQWEDAKALTFVDKDGSFADKEIAVPLMSTYRTLRSKGIPRQEVVGFVGGLVKQSESKHEISPELPLVYAESLQKLLGQGKPPAEIVPYLENLLETLKPSESFRKNPASALKLALEVSQTVGVEPTPAAPVQIVESKESVMIGGIRIKKKGSTAPAQ